MTIIPEHKEDCMANAYDQWLPEQGQIYVVNRLIAEMCETPLDEEEIKIIAKMVMDRNYTGKGDPGFGDIRSSMW